MISQIMISTGKRSLLRFSFHGHSDRGSTHVVQFHFTEIGTRFTLLVHSPHPALSLWIYLYIGLFRLCMSLSFPSKSSPPTA